MAGADYFQIADKPSKIVGSAVPQKL